MGPNFLQRLSTDDKLLQARDSTELNMHAKLSSFFCVCLIWSFTSHQQSFSYIGTGLPRLNQYLARINVLAQGHNAEMPVRFRTAALWSWVKHSTTATALPKETFRWNYSEFWSSVQEMLYKDFSTFSSGGHFVWHRGAVWANLAEGLALMRKI